MSISETCQKRAGWGNVIKKPPRPSSWNASSRRAPERKYVTIAAGFLCSDGAVLCADTEELTGSLKTRVPKLITREHEGRLHAVFAGSGSGPLIDKLVEKMWDRAVNQKGPIAAVAKAMEDENADYREDLRRCYRESDPCYPEADLVFGLSMGNEVVLPKVTGGITNPISRYETIGGGYSVAKYIVDRVLTPGAPLPSTKIAAILALYIVEQAKLYVEGCGGESHVVVMKNGQTPEFLPSHILTSMVFGLKNSEVTAHRVLMAVPDAALTDQEFDNELQRVQEMMRHSRTMVRDSLEQFGKWFNGPRGKSGT